MKRFVLLSALVAAVLAFGACSSDDDTVTSSTITAQSVSGNGYSLDGTWVSCFGSPIDFSEIRVISGSSMTQNAFNYSSTDGSCSTGAVEDTTQAASITFSNATTFTVAGWSNGTAIDAAPTAQDGATTIPETPVVTRVDISGTFGGSTVTGKMVFYIDDSDTAGDVIWYRSFGIPAECDPDSSGSEQCLLNKDFFIQQ